MKLGLKNKIALVTASSKGLGRASAEALAEEGAKIAICARDGQVLKAAADEIANTTRSEVLAIPADMTSSADIEQVVKETVNHFGALHVLVTNAGGPPAGYFDDFDDRQWQEAFNLTMMSAVRLIRVAIPHMEKEKWGRIINITSVSVKEPIDNLILSNSIRASVHGMAKTLANQVANHGITINNVMPGYIHTDRVQQLVQNTAERTGQTEDQVLAGLSERTPVGRVGQPKELGALVAFLASEQAAYINGVSIPMDGGRLSSAF
jgi:3-oxoacyl-[acyl-carrier protein] reductase